MVGPISTAILTKTHNRIATTTAVWVYVGKCWVYPGSHGWRLPCLPNMVTTTILVTLGWRFLSVGFGVLGIGLQTGVGVNGVHNALPRAATICGWLAPVLGVKAPKSGVNGNPGPVVLRHFLSFPLMGLYPPRVFVTQAYTDFPRWTSFRTVGMYCSIQNYSVWRNNICLYMHRFYLWPCLHHICASRPQWEIATVSHPVTAIAMNMRGTHIRNLLPQHWEPDSMGKSVAWGHFLHT